MHDFRRRPEDVTPEQTKALEALFDKVPTLGVIYHLRWRATQIFDTAGSPAAAARALNEWIAEARESELDWEPFITMLKGHLERHLGLLRRPLHEWTGGGHQQQDPRDHASRLRHPQRRHAVDTGDTGYQLGL
jgi:hypothetical protein